MFRSALRSTLGLTGVTGLLSAGLVLGTTAPALADDACQRDAATVTCTYSFTGGEQVFVVPAGVSLLDVTAIGGTGGRALGASSAARPVRVAGELPVQPGQTLVVSVGGDGGVPTLSTEGVPTPGGAGGFNGGARGGSALGVPGHVSGAGGGGASDVRLISRTEPGSLESRLLVAAGSGGASAADGGAGDPTAWTYAPVADVEGTDVDGTDVEGADVEGADVEGADVEGADVEGADVEGADVEGADVEGADVEGADVEGADVEGADVEGTGVEGADVDEQPVRAEQPWDQWRADGRFGEGTSGAGEDAATEAACCAGGGGGGGVYGGRGGGIGSGGEGGTSLIPAGGSSELVEGAAVVTLSYALPNAAPVPEPAEPVQKPIAPVEEPVAPVEEPVAPVEEPTEPVREPAAPVEESAAPVEELAAPVEPVEEPAAPVEEPVAPVEPVEAAIAGPADPAPAPAEVPAAPESSSDVEMPAGVQAPDAPVEEAPGEGIPAEQAPSDAAPVEEAPVEEAPVEEAPVDGPTVTAAAPQVVPSTTQVLTGTGFAPGEVVAGTLASEPADHVTAVADRTGTVEVAVELPESVEPGDHSVTLEGASSGRVGSAGFAVQSAQSRSFLDAGGVRLLAGGVLGGGILAIGVGVVAAVRRPL